MHLKKVLSLTKKLVLKTWYSAANDFSFRYFLLFIPVFFADIIFLYVVQDKHEFIFPDTVTMAFMLEKILFDVFFITGATLALLKSSKTKVFPVIFYSFYIFIQFLDIGLYHFSNTIFEYHFLSLVDWNAFNDLLGPLIWGLITAFAVIVIWNIFSLYKVAKKRVSWATVTVFLILSAVIGLSKIPAGFDILIHGKLKPRSLEWNIRREIKTQLEYVSKNSFINFLDEIMRRNTDYVVTDNIEPYKDVIERYKLPIGKREYEDLDLEKYNKIILFTTESLSLEFLKKYNTEMPVDLAPFYSSDEMGRYFFSDFRTSGSPTLQGLTVAFNSHPNFDLLLSGNYQNSLPKILKSDGYETIFLRSATKYFASENIHFKNYGFDTVIGSEDFREIPGMEKYIYRWGVMDIFLYEKLFDMVRERRNGKYFITVLNVDTHPPYGRRIFKDVAMPKLPDGMKKLNHQAARYLKNIYYHDQYMKNFVEKLKDEGLFTDDVLLVFTADHACQPNSIVKKIKGYESKTLAKIVLTFLTTQSLPEVNNEITSSQMDIAPTILHLLDKPIPRGYWGDSLFSAEKKSYYIGVIKNKLYLEYPGRKHMINIKKPAGKTKDIIDLYNTIIKD